MYSFTVGSVKSESSFTGIVYSLKTVTESKFELTTDEYGLMHSD